MSYGVTPVTCVLLLLVQVKVSLLVVAMIVPFVYGTSVRASVLRSCRVTPVESQVLLLMSAVQSSLAAVKIQPRACGKSALDIVFKRCKATRTRFDRWHLTWMARHLPAGETIG